MVTPSIVSYRRPLQWKVMVQPKVECVCSNTLKDAYTPEASQKALTAKLSEGFRIVDGEEGRVFQIGTFRPIYDGQKTCNILSQI